MMNYSHFGHRFRGLVIKRGEKNQVRPWHIGTTSIEGEKVRSQNISISYKGESRQEIHPFDIKYI